MEYAQTTEMCRILKCKYTAIFKTGNILGNNLSHNTFEDYIKKIKHSESNYTSTTCHQSQDADDLVRIETQLSKTSKYLNTLYEEDSKFEATCDLKRVLVYKENLNYANYQIETHLFETGSGEIAATFTSIRNDIVSRKSQSDETNLCKELLSQMEHYNNHLSVSWETNTFNDHSQLAEYTLNQAKNLRVSQGIEELLEDDQVVSLPIVSICHASQSVSHTNQITFRNIMRPHKDLEEWLGNIGLESVGNSLARNGILTSGALLKQLKNLNYTDKHLLLKSKGVEKSGSRDRIILGIAQDSGEYRNCIETSINNKSIEIGLQCCSKAPHMCPDFINPPSLRNWLRDQGLEDTYNKFVMAGYDDYEWLLIQMASACPLTDRILEDEIGITQPGVQYRLLFRLKDGKFF